jgi:hypothetical protein
MLCGFLCAALYWAQVVSELFACAAWWATVVWCRHQWRGAALLFALFGSAVFVTWPIWVGPAVALFAITVVTNVVSGSRGVRAALSPLVIGIVPIAFVAAVHTIGRSDVYKWRQPLASSSVHRPQRWAELSSPWRAPAWPSQSSRRGRDSRSFCWRHRAAGARAVRVRAHAAPTPYASR